MNNDNLRQRLAWRHGGVGQNVGELLALPGGACLLRALSLRLYKVNFQGQARCYTNVSLPHIEAKHCSAEVESHGRGRRKAKGGRRKAKEGDGVMG